MVDGPVDDLDGQEASIHPAPPISYDGPTSPSEALLIGPATEVIMPADDKSEPTPPASTGGLASVGVDGQRMPHRAPSPPASPRSTSLNMATSAEPVLHSLVGGQLQSKPPLERLHPTGAQSPLPSRFSKVYFKLCRHMQHTDQATGTDAIMAPKAPVEAMQQPSALGTLTAPLSASNVPVAGSITHMQQIFLDQITKKIGSVIPAPRINKRRAKGPPRSQSWCSRRLARLPAGQGQPSLSRPKKEVMRVLGFAQEHEQISQQNLDRYSKLLLQPLTPPPSDSVACNALRVGSARGVLSCLYSGRNVQFSHGSGSYSLLECSRLILLGSAEVAQKLGFIYEHRCSVYSRI
jgi:hypothetical protein